MCLLGLLPFVSDFVNAAPYKICPPHFIEFVTIRNSPWLQV